MNIRAFKSSLLINYIGTKYKWKKTLAGSRHLFFPFFIFTCMGSIIAILSGSDASFDTLNYHLFNGWATFRGAEVDYLPTSIWTFFPSHLDFLYYVMWSNLPTIAVSMILGGFQGLIGFLVYRTVGLFEENDRKTSTRGIVFGTLALGSPLILAQLGNAMHDATLAVLEFYVVYNLLRLRIVSLASLPTSIPLIIGLVAALKPAHISFVILATVIIVVQSKSFRERLRSLSITAITFILFSIPWWYKSFVVTGTPIFPYLEIGNKNLVTDLLSSGEILHGYKEWKIDSFSKFTRHLLFPGGSPALNHEIFFLDFTIPTALFLALILPTLSIWKKSTKKQLEKQFMTGFVLLGSAITMYMFNQLFFTGIRYSLVVFPMVISTLGIWSTSSEVKIQSAVKFSVILLVTLNLFLPNSIYLPNRINPIFSSSVPDYGRSSHSFLKPIRSGFKPSYTITERDYVILGQEQISFVGALWNQDSKFIGLQAYILGNDAKQEIRTRLATTTASGGSVYIVTLTQNLETMKSQLEKVSIAYRIAECRFVDNPFKRDISMCKVI